MTDVLRTRLTEMRKNSTKGFTLVELIVVILIIAILIAALAPAILGAIERANVSADHADARSVMLAGSMAALATNPPAVPANSAAVIPHLQGGNPFGGATATVRVFFDGNVASGFQITAGGRAHPANNTIVGVQTGSHVDVVVNPTTT